MGTKTNSRRSSRASKRGLASFVSFLLLFAFALGQSSLIALANDSGTAPAATDDAGSDGSVSRLSTLPVAQAPAAEASGTDASGGDSAASSSGGAASTSRTTSPTRTLDISSANKPAALAAPAAPPAGGLEGGDISLDFVAAGPFTYNHVTGLGSPPQFGYDNRTISKTNGVVESLEGGDFECGDLVTFFVAVEVAGDAAGSGDVELDMSFGNETTGQPGIGFDNIMSVAINTPDGGNVGLDGDETATLSNEHLDTQGYDEVKGTVTVTSLDPGETAIVRIIVRLACEVGTPTGNILNAIDAARVVGDGTVNVGQETVPMKQVGDVAQPGLDVNKTCPASAAIGDTITYSIEIVNTGNETLNIQSVIDTVDSHSAANITASFPATVAAAASVTRTYTYTVLASDPDPLPNSVAVVAKGAISQATINGSASCQTDITHVPAIDVTKTCPQSVPFGEDVTFTITVKNTGNEPLTGVSVTDDLLGGDITAAFSIPDPMPVGVLYSHQFTYSPGADEDPVQNSVTATGFGADSQVKAEDTASCETDVTHAPALEVTKECPQTVPFGEDITYTITVTNTGNEALEGVTVNDTLLGDITDQFDVDFSGSFGVGEVATATVTYSPGADEDPVSNTVTVAGTGADSGAEASGEASCRTDVLHPQIQIVKDGPGLVHVGDTITYSFTVTNPGELELFDVVLSDPICDAGTILPGADVDSSLAVGEVWHYSCTHLVTDTDPDPLPNTATINGDTSQGEGGEPVSDTDDHLVDIIHPGISIVKTVDEEVVPIGTTVTFTYVIVNTGDTTLYNVSVDDDILGHIGDIPVLEPGIPVTLTKDFVVGDEIVTNVGTATGEDVLGRSVSANDTATVAPIAGENPPPPSTPFTGSDAGRLGLITMGLFGIGVTVVASTRRRRTKDEAA
jgi:uncharacterized repeat protein (TIGR01451 family)